MKMKKFILSMAILGSNLTMAQQTIWSLEDCISYALENDYLVKEKALNQEYYQKEIKGSYGNFLPNANLYADHQYNFGSVIDPTTNNRVSSDIQSNSIQFSSQIELFNWGNFIRLKSARLQKEKATYDLEIQKNELIIRIVQAYHQVLFDHEQVELIEKQMVNTDLNLNRIETEFKLGNKPKSDVYEMQAQKSAEEQRLTQAKNALNLSQSNLKNILNWKGELEIEKSESDEFVLIEDSLENLYEQGKDSRPELKSAEIQTEISQQNIRLQKSNYLPKLNGNYALSSFYVDTETASLSDQFKNNTNHFLGISLNVPIFNRLQTQTAVQQAKIQAEQAFLQSEQQKQAYFNALRDAYTKSLNAYDNWQFSEENLKAQKISFVKTEEKFKQGMVDSYGYFAAKNNLLQAETAFLQAKYTFQYENLLLNWYVTNEL
jgi:outer membrane protein